MVQGREEKNLTFISLLFSTLCLAYGRLSYAVSLICVDANDADSVSTTSLARFVSGNNENINEGWSPNHEPQVQYRTTEPCSPNSQHYDDWWSAALVYLVAKNVPSSHIHASTVQKRNEKWRTTGHSWGGRGFGVQRVRISTCQNQFASLIWHVQWTLQCHFSSNCHQRHMLLHIEC